MPNKTLSVRDDDLPLWERAERTAKANRQSLSGLVATALARHLGETDTITVEIAGGRRVQFAGRWLVTPPPEPSFGDPQPAEDDPAYGQVGHPAEWRAGIAETARGRVAIYLWHWDGMEVSELHDFDTLDQAEAALGADPRIPPDTWSKARHDLTGGETVQWRDI